MSTLALQNKSANPSQIRRKPIISNYSFAVLVLVFVEAMFFAALLSSYFVIRRGRVLWDIPGNIHLPVGAEAFNTGVLLVSALSLFLALRAQSKGKGAAAVRGHVIRAAVLGAFFLGCQAYWSMKLSSLGLTMGTSIYGACYYLLTVTHSFHALIGVLALVFFMFRGLDLQPKALRALFIFWLFVAGVWPFLYAQLYF